MQEINIIKEGDYYCLYDENGYRYLTVPRLVFEGLMSPRKEFSDVEKIQVKPELWLVDTGACYYLSSSPYIPETRTWLYCHPTVYMLSPKLINVLALKNEIPKNGKKLSPKEIETLFKF